MTRARDTGETPQDRRDRAELEALSRQIAEALTEALPSELGFALAPSAFYPARTTGIGGFQVSLEASYTPISSDRAVEVGKGNYQQYWHLGTRGTQDPGSKQFSISNASPDGVI